jgi:hypothetical protein
MGVYKFSEAGTFVEPRTLYKSMLAGNEAFVIPGDYELIESAILTSSQASITFSGLGSYASTYKHLQVRITARGTQAQIFGQANLRFNGDSGSNYAEHRLRGTGSAVQSTGGGSTSFIGLDQVTGSTSATGSFGAFVVDILDFSSSTKNTTVRALTGSLNDNQVSFRSGLYNNTAAITEIFIGAGSADNFVAGSRFSLYGIRG